MAVPTWPCPSEPPALRLPSLTYGVPSRSVGSLFSGDVMGLVRQTLYTETELGPEPGARAAHPRLGLSLQLSQQWPRQDHRHPWPEREGVLRGQ